MDSNIDFFNDMESLNLLESNEEIVMADEILTENESIEPSDNVNFEINSDQDGLEEFLGLNNNEQISVNDTDHDDQNHTLVDPQGLPQEDPLDELLESALGKDPDESNALKLKIHTKIVVRWGQYLKKGIPKDEKETLLAKYEVPAIWKPPTLNPEIKRFLSSNQRYKNTDDLRLHLQKLGSTALTSLGGVLDLISGFGDFPEKKEIIERLVDATKLLAEMQHKQSVSRKAAILPFISKPLRDTLQTVEFGELLFGSDLPQRIRDAKAVENICKDMRIKRQPNNDWNQNTNKSLNLRAPGKLPSSPMKGQSRASTNSSFRPSPYKRPQQRNAQSTSSQQQSPKKSLDFQKTPKK